MRYKNIFFTLLVMFLSGCATTNTSNIAIDYEKTGLTYNQEKTWEIMIGKWYGSQPVKDGGTRQWIAERSDDGTYKITFRRYGKNGEIEEQTEVGYWGVSGPIYFSIFKGWVKDGYLEPSNPRDPYNYDAYRIISLTDSVMEYESASSGNRYTLKKVATDFWFLEK